MRLLLFTSPTCSVCPQAKKTANMVLPDYYSEGLSLEKYNAFKGDGKMMSAKYYVSSVPTFLFLDKDGNELKRIVGAPSESSLRRTTETLLGLRKPLIQRIFGSKN